MKPIEEKMWKETEDLRWQAVPGPEGFPNETFRGRPLEERGKGNVALKEKGLTGCFATEVRNPAPSDVSSQFRWLRLRVSTYYLR